MTIVDLKPDPTRYWFDTEFMEDGMVIIPLSLGIVCEDGRELYMEFDVDYSLANEWVQDNVIPHLGMSPQWTDKWSRGAAAGELLKFVNAGATRPEFWAYYADYDWVLLCQLYGRMIDLPVSWPKMCMDVKQKCVDLGDPELPEQTGPEHHALYDARWTREAWDFLEDYRVGSPSSTE